MEVFHKIVTVSNLQHDCPSQPITGFDVGNPAGGTGLALVYDSVLNRQRLIASLQKVLDRAPYFAGRVCGLGSAQPQVVANNEGVLFTYANYCERMPAYGIDQPLKPQAHHFVPFIDHAGFDQHTPLLQIKLSQFLNGSILGIAVSHVFCDGISMIDFIKSWADDARHAIVQPPPNCDRSLIKTAAALDVTPSCSSPSMIELIQPLKFYDRPVVSEPFHLPGTLLELLYRNYGDADPAVASRQDIVTAFIFTLMVRCRSNPDQLCPLTLVYNIRKTLNLPTDYLGNAITLRCLKYTGTQIIELGVGALARTIRRLYTEISAVDLLQECAFMQQKMAAGTAALFLPEATYLPLTGGVLFDNVAKFPAVRVGFWRRPADLARHTAATIADAGLSRRVAMPYPTGSRRYRYSCHATQRGNGQFS